MSDKKSNLPVIGMLYLDHVLQFFDKSNFKGWPNKIETVVYHWGNDKKRFIEEVKQKKIDVLIGNIPATAYETFRDIERELPDVKFIPSMDTQFANKSKENVTLFCEKYSLPIPKTHIFYDLNEARKFLATTDYPKIIKRSYGPSNYGGYFVHKVDSESDALSLLTNKGYYPVYLQDFVPMKADIRVMLIGHKPVCAFWRRPPEGEWLTNTSQGGSMDYMDVPTEALELAVRASKAANAEYWACDIAVSFDDQYSILECATAFAAFPYIRDWIGQYLMWKLSDGQMPRPHIPMYNWEELGKVSSSVLRTMRHIYFSRSPEEQAMTDTGEVFQELNTKGYPIINTRERQREEWPSEQFNRQDNYDRRRSGNLQIDDSATNLPLSTAEVLESKLASQALPDTGIEDVILPAAAATFIKSTVKSTAEESQPSQPEPLSQDQLIVILADARGVSLRLAESIVIKLGVEGTLDALNNNPGRLTEVKNIKARKLAHIMKHWEKHLETC